MADKASPKIRSTSPPPSGLSIAATNIAEPGSIAKQRRPIAPRQQARTAYLDALAMLARGDSGAARQQLGYVLELDAGHHKARETLGALFIKEARFEEAKELLKVGLQHSPGNPRFANLYARVVLERGDVIGAIKALEAALSNARGDADYLALLAALYQRAERHEKAINHYRQALRLRSEEGVWWMGLAISHEKRNETSKALAAYRRAKTTSALSGSVAAYVQGRIRALAGS
jgi:MSHA biogenesis protein MshN